MIKRKNQPPSGWFFYGGYLYLPAILPARGMHQILL